ncbi:MAG: cell division protein FtsX [Actinobacteria bacterium HGW-Actinobacteria-7]|nr:MAG: cell division protein FtsX [Actinobacteria bacterium HGW-Actinobacteria-7]
MSVLGRKRRRDIGRQRWQFASVAVTIVLGVMMYCASYDAYQNLYASYHGTYDRLRFADVVVTGASDQFAGQVSRVAGVESVEKRIQADVPLRIGGHELVGRIVGLPDSGQPAIDRLDLVSGAFPPVGATAQVLAETHLAKTFQLATGGSVELLTARGWQELSIAGEVISAEYLWPAPSSQQLFAAPEDFGVLFVPESLVPLAAAPAVQHQVLVSYTSDADRVATDAKVRYLADAAGADDVTMQVDQPSNKALSLDLQGFEQMAWLFPAMFLFAAGLATFLLLTRVVYAQRNQIGTLRANGLSQNAVLRHYLGYGLWVGGWGSVLGVALGVPSGWAITAAYTAELGIPDTIRQLYPVTPVIGLAFGVGAGLLAAWVPARAAVRMDPAEAMRGSIPVSSGTRSLLEVLVPPLNRAPVRWRMVLRGFGRNPRRSISTVIGIVLALMLLLTSWGMLDTTEILMNKQFNQVQLEDAQVVPENGLDGSLLESLRAVPGVRVVEQVSAIDVSVSGPKGSYSTQLLAYPANTRMHAFGSAARTPQAGRIVVGAAVLDKTGVPVGGRLSVRSPSLDKRFTATIGGAVEEPLGTFVYASPATLQEALREAGTADPEDVLARGYSVAFVKFQPGVDRAKVVQDIRDLDGIATATDSRVLYALVQQYMGFFYLFIGFMLFFGGVMALALIFNTVSVNLAERSTELASMRANGMSKALIARLVTAENLILTAVGIVPGLVVGTFAASRFMGTYSSDLFIFTLHIKPSTYVYASLAMFAVTGLSLLPGIRAVGRVDIARVVRERSQ